MQCSWKTVSIFYIAEMLNYTEIVTAYTFSKSILQEFTSLNNSLDFHQGKTNQNEKQYILAKDFQKLEVD